MFVYIKRTSMSTTRLGTSGVKCTCKETQAPVMRNEQYGECIYTLVEDTESGNTFLTGTGTESDKVNFDTCKGSRLANNILRECNNGTDTGCYVVVKDIPTKGKICVKVLDNFYCFSVREDN